MFDFLRQRARLVPFLLSCSAGSLDSILLVRDWGNRMSQVDAGSEANTPGEVHHFLEDTPGNYYGLRNINYSGLYPDDGITDSSLDGPYGNAAATLNVRNHILTPQGVYMHYPPGSEYLSYDAAKLLGAEPVSPLRGRADFGRRLLAGESVPAILASASWVTVMVKEVFHEPIILGFFVCVLFGALKVSRCLAEVPALQPAT
jgi:hypothetical protein